MASILDHHVGASRVVDSVLLRVDTSVAGRSGVAQSMIARSPRKFFTSVN